MLQRKTRTATLGLLVGAVLIAGACSSSTTKTTNTTAAPKSDTTKAGVATTAAPAKTTVAAPAAATGTVVVAIADKFTAYNNFTGDDNLFSNQEILNPIQAYASYYIDKGGKLVLNKELIESAELTSKSPQVTTYKINPKAVWSDGTPVTGADFYLNWIATNGKVMVKDADGKDAPLFAAASTTGAEQIKSVETSADGKTVVVTYDKPFSDWLGMFTPMLPAHAIAKAAGVDIKKAYEAATAATPNLDDIKKLGEFWNNGMKTEGGLKADLWLSAGPYVISEYKTDESVTLTPNPKWWGTPAKTGKIVYRIITDDTAAAQALQNKEVDFIAPQPDPDLLNQLKGATGVTTTVSSGFTFEHFDMNLKNPVLADPAVRQAVALCLPRQEIIDKLIKPVNADAKLVNNRIYMPFQADYKDNSGGKYDKVDIAGAKAAMEAAGWKLNGATYEKGGVKAEFKLLHKKNARRQAEWELTQASCSKAGISVLDDGDDKWSRRAGNKDYDAAVFAWTGADLLSPQKSQYFTDAGQNWNNYSNPIVDAAMTTLAEDLDSTKWAAAANAADVQMWKDLVTLPIFQFVDVYSWANKVAGPSYNPTSQGATWNVQAWTVK
jgi:peptide/nickel transport system substrate-binding protein